MIYELMMSPVTGFYVGILFTSIGVSVLWILAILFHVFMKNGDSKEISLVHHTRDGEEVSRGIILEEGMTFVQIHDDELAPGFTWSSTGFVPDEPD